MFKAGTLHEEQLVGEILQSRAKRQAPLFKDHIRSTMAAGLHEVLAVAR